MRLIASSFFWTSLVLQRVMELGGGRMNIGTPSMSENANGTPDPDSTLLRS